MPSTIVTGRTTRSDEPSRAPRVSSGWPGVERLRARRGRATRPTMAERRDERSGSPARSRIGSPIRGRSDAKRSGADARCPIRNVARIDREHVGRVAGPGREQPGPGDLVAERRQARDEGDGQRERVGRRVGRARSPASAIGGDSARGRSTLRRSAAASSQRGRRTPGDRRARRRRPRARPDSPSSSIRTKPGRERCRRSRRPCSRRTAGRTPRSAAASRAR